MMLHFYQCLHFMFFNFNLWQATNSLWTIFALSECSCVLLRYILHESYIFVRNATDSTDKLLSYFRNASLRFG